MTENPPIPTPGDKPAPSGAAIPPVTPAGLPARDATPPRPEAKVEPSKPPPSRPEMAKPETAKPEMPKPEMAKVDPPKPEVARPAAAPPPRPEAARPASPPTQPAASRPASAPPPAPLPATPPRPPTGSSRSALAVFCGLGFLVLAGAGFFLWTRIEQLERNADPVRVTVLESQVRLLQQRLTQLEQAPPPAPPPAPAPAPAPPPPAPTVNLAPLEQRLAALEKRPLPPPAPDLAPLTAKLDALDRKLTQSESQANQTIDRAGRIARLQVAETALEQGQPLGEIPGAPPALARFATAKPPTEAALRLAFPSAARIATEASQPGTEGKPLVDRMWTKITRLVTVRAGNEVLVGAPATVVLADARRKLDAGDLAGAIAALDGLDPAAALAMADWRAQAQSLVDARAALAAMARG